MPKRTLQLGAALLVFSVLLQAAETFKDVEYMYKPEGKDKGQQISGKLAFDSAAQTMAFQSKKMTLGDHLKTGHTWSLQNRPTK